MKFIPDLVTRSVIIAALAGAGIWYAQAPDFQHWPFYCFPAQAKGTDLSHVTISRIDWSADGRKLLLRFRGDPDAHGQLALYDATEAFGSLPIDIPGNDLSTFALAPDGRRLVAGLYDGRLWWIALDSADPAVELLKSPSPTFLTATAVVPDSLRIAAGTNTGSIYLCHPLHRTTTKLDCGQVSALCDLYFSSDGNRLLATQCNGRVTLWDLTTGRMIQKFGGDGKRIAVRNFLWDGERIITAAEYDSVRVWEIASGRELWRGDFGALGVSTLAVSPDGKAAAWAGYDRRIIVWDLEKETRRFEIPTSAPAVFHLKFSPDGSKLAVAAHESTLRMYNARTGGETNHIDVAPPEVF